MKIFNYISPLTLCPLLLSVTTTLGFACYIAYNDSTCSGSNVSANCANGCHYVNYDPQYNSHCSDSGEDCGKMDCTDTSVTAIKTEYWLTPGGTPCGCALPFTAGPIVTEAGNCQRASLSGDACGYCP